MKCWTGIKWDVLQCIDAYKPNVLETLILYDNQVMVTWKIKHII